MTTPLHHERLQDVLDLLLDLANDGKNCWQQITDKQNERIAGLKDTSKTQLDRRIDPKQSNWLHDALIVKWEESDDENWLLVTSSFYESDDQEMNVSSFRAIRHCLLLRKNTDYKDRHVYDAFKLLAALGLLDDRTGTKEVNVGYRRFRINFSNCPSRQRDACKAHVRTRWNDKCPPKQKRAADAIPRTKAPEAHLNRQLDDLVSRHKEAVDHKLTERRKAEKKHLHVPLKVKIVRPGASEAEGSECLPEPADLRAAVEAKGGQLLVIWEEGGAGKTSLAFEIAQWAVRGRLAGHDLLPFFWEPLGDPAEEPALGQRVAGELNNFSGSSITPDEVDLLLRYKRLLLIADHFSELTDDQRRWFERNLPDKCLVLLTSRLREHGQKLTKSRGFTLTEIQPQRLKEEELFRFFEEYLDQRAVEEGKGGLDPWLSPDDVMETRGLLERMVGNQPITVLLAWMVIEKAIQHIRACKDDSNPGVKDLLPSSVP
ncbi:MAG: NACHT domain-containing protein, partial [Cyanobium sp.]